MKKFTSLFALLSCLCVVSAQAETTISTLTITGQFNGWNSTSNPLEQTGTNVWSCNLDLTNTTDDVMFKFVINSYSDYLGYTNGVNVDAPELWVSSVESDNNNFKLWNTKTGFKTYKITATWTPSDNVYTGWTIKVEGVQTRYTYTVVGTGALFDSEWNVEDSRFDMSLDTDGAHFIFNEVVNLNGNEFYFKIVKDHNWDNGSFPNNNYYVHNYGGEGLYEVTIKYYPPYLDGGVSCTLTNMSENNLTIVDGEPFQAQGDNITVSSASYTRNCGSNLWGTLCLPFTFNVAEQNNVTFYYLPEGGVNADERSITFQPYEDGSVDGGMAVLFKLGSEANGSLSITASGGNVNVVSNAAVSEMEGVMIGTFKQVVKNYDVYYISGDDFYYGTNITINPYRAWIEAQIPSDGSGAPFRISVDDTEGLQFVEQEDGTVKAYYDLQGRKLDSARKGLVIENGKIIMVK